MSNYKHIWWPSIKELVRDYYTGRCQDEHGAEAIRLALEETDQKKTGKERRDLVAMLYGKRNMTMAGATIKVHISVETAKRWHGDFIRAVAKYYQKIKS